VFPKYVTTGKLIALDHGCSPKFTESNAIHFFPKNLEFFIEADLNLTA